jgi:predicted phosphohydrolase
MRLVVISDTHMRHDRLCLPEAELTVHAGDFTRRGSRGETLRFLDWFARSPGPHRVLVAGNHDAWPESEPEAMAAACAERAITYLCDGGATVGGLRVWGSPATPRFRSMAFNRERGPDIRRHWEPIPVGLDLLITHGPPRGILDRVVFGAHVGCDDLREVVARRTPRLHVFGHIHEAAGDVVVGPTRYINAATSRLLLGQRTARVVDLDGIGGGQASNRPALVSAGDGG